MCISIDWIWSFFPISKHKPLIQRNSSICPSGNSWRRWNWQFTFPQNSEVCPTLFSHPLLFPSTWLSKPTCGCRLLSISDINKFTFPCYVLLHYLSLTIITSLSASSLYDMNLTQQKKLMASLMTAWDLVWSQTTWESMDTMLLVADDINFFNYQSITPKQDKGI